MVVQLKTVWCRSQSVRVDRTLAHAMAALGWLIAGQAPVLAQDVVSFRGKTVRMIVGSVAGGLTDVGARMIARFMGKHLPQGPTIVVQNMPAANGIAAANYFYQQIPADGLTFIAGSSSQVTPDVIRTNAAVRYLPAKFVFIGGIQNAGTLLIVSKRALERLTDRSREPVVMAQVGGTRTGALISVWGAEYLGWNVRWVTGYQGTPQTVTALMRGEADMIDTAGVAVIDPLVKTGEFMPIVQPGVAVNGKLRRRDAFPEVPLATELLAGRVGTSARNALDSWLKAVQIGKYYALPPNTPPGYVAAYREAFTRMLDDPDFQRQAKTAIDPDYVMMSAAETGALIEQLVATPDEDLEFLNRLRAKYGLPSGDIRDR
jgi:tripartite-type tricarboxylate transporter receptor subunit TctC